MAHVIELCKPLHHHKAEAGGEAWTFAGRAACFCQTASRSGPPAPQLSGTSARARGGIVPAAGGCRGAHVGTPASQKLPCLQKKPSDLILLTAIRPWGKTSQILFIHDRPISLNPSLLHGRWRLRRR